MFGRRALVYLVGAVVVAGAGSACSLFGGGDEKAGDKEASPSSTHGQAGPGRASTTTSRPAGPESFILNEIRISGDAQFVELKNAGSGPASPAGLTLAATSSQFVLPASLAAVPPGGVIVVLFDGKSGVEGTTVHAPLARVFDAAGDAVALQLGETIFDRAAWGDVDGPNVYLGTGGRTPDPERGSVIVRPPGAKDAAAAWNYVGQADGSPGKPNPAVGVSAFATIDGALFLTSPSLAWYSVPGGVSYLVEVARSDFKSTLWKTTVTPSASGALEQLSATPPRLTGSRFSWRVSATYGDGSSVVSAIQTFRTLASGATSASSTTPSPVPSATASPAASAPPSSTATTAATPVVKRVPGVRQVYQRKDTALLELENPTESGPLAWDKPDAEGTHNRPFCAAAAMAMMADFFGGFFQEMSIDRLRYEANLGDRPRPERDLPKWGMDDPEINRALAWAFSPAPAFHRNDTVGNVLAWIAAIRTEIDAGRPMLASYPSHMFLIVGYTEDDGEGDFAFLFKDGNGMEYLSSFDPNDLPSQDPNYRLRPSGVDVWWTFAAGTTVTDGGDMEADGDGDGVMDFDETNRFKTSPSNVDSDSDDVHDKEEIRASTWDPKYGYLGQSGQFMPRDHDRDGLKMELDPDSDDGGCLDGLEDLDHDGDREEPKETSAFEKKDDRCISGKFLLRLTQNSVTESQTVNIETEMEVTISLKPKDDGSVEGMGAVEFFYVMTDVSRHSGEDCLTVLPLFLDSWPVKITGRFTQNVLSFGVDPPSHTVTLPFFFCDGADSLVLEVGWLRGWADITFTDGIYEYTADSLHGAPDTGNTHVELKLKQKKPE
jgi:hypothetical protein